MMMMPGMMPGMMGMMDPSMLAMMGGMGAVDPQAATKALTTRALVAHFSDVLI